MRRKYRYVQRLIEENKEKLKDAEKSKSIEEIDELVETQTRLKNADVEIAKQLGIVSGKYWSGTHRIDLTLKSRPTVIMVTDFTSYDKD